VTVLAFAGAGAHGAMGDCLELDGFSKQVSVYSNISRYSDPDALLDPEVFSRQCTEIDEMATRLVDQATVEAALRGAIRDCRFCVTVADPQREDCPLIAVSDEFQTMTGYSRDEVVGKNCRFLNRNCYLEPCTFTNLRHACKTGAPFTATILNRKKSGDLFMNLINLQGLVVAKNTRGDTLWFIVGIQADVTNVCLDDDIDVSDEHNAQLQEVAQIIRERLTSELSTLAVSGSLRAETRGSASAGQPSPSWWLLPDPMYAMADTHVFSRQRTLFDTVMESEFAEALSDDELDQVPESDRPASASKPAKLESFARQQSQRIDAIMPSAMTWENMDKALPDAMQDAVTDCTFAVSIGDPRADDCPLVAVSDQFEVLTGYSREEIIGKNCRFLSRNCPIGEQDHLALREACLKGTPFCKIIVNRRKSGDLFLNLLDLRGITVARNVGTREELWFLVAIQADVTHLDSTQLPKDHMEAIHSVASRIRSRLADELSLMALAGSTAMGCLNTAKETLWVPMDSPRWMKGQPVCRRQTSDSHLQTIVERVRQSSSRQVSAGTGSRQLSTSRQASQGRPAAPSSEGDGVSRAGYAKAMLVTPSVSLSIQSAAVWQLCRGAFWIFLGGSGFLALLQQRGLLSLSGLRHSRT